MDFSYEDPEALFADDLWGSVLGLLIFSVLTYIFLFAVINEYVKKYIATGNSSIEINDLWNSVKSNLGNYAASMIAYFILVIVFSVAVIIPFALFAAADSVLFIIVAFLGMIVLFVMLLCVSYLVIIVYNTEPEGLFSSIGRSVELLKGKWLSTFGIIIISSLLASIASFIFAIPNYAVTAIGLVHGIEDPEAIDFSFSQSIIYGITSFIAAAGQFLMIVIPILAVIFQYYNLVERRDASGLMQRIDQMGTGKGEDIEETY